MSFQHKFLRSYMLIKFDYIKRDWRQICQLSMIFEFLTPVTMKEIYDTL
jgi:transcription antitermination factor NusG